jgi:hypothetical protein
VNSKAWIKAILLFLGIGLTAGLLFYPLPVLQVKDNTDQVLLIPLLQGKNLTLEYFHSVQKTPVQEHFTIISGNQLQLTSTTYQSLGVGLPFLPSEGELVNNQGTFELTGLNRVFREMRLAVMPVTYQGLVYNNRCYVLSNYFSSGSLVDISVQSYSPGYLIWHKITALKGGSL